MKIAALLLAAGLSQRMDGQNKLLALLHGKPLIRHAAENLSASSAHPIIVITGHQAEAIQQALAGLPVTYCYAAGYQQGMGKSLAAGAAALPEDAAGAFVALGDMPFAAAAMIDHLARFMTIAPEYKIYAPLFRGRRGHPVLFRRAVFAELAKLSDDEGAKTVIARHEPDLVLIPQKDDSCLRDIDSTAALSAAQKSERGR